MSQSLSGCVLALLLTDGMEGGQVTRLRTLLRRAGARVHLVAPGGGLAHAQDGARFACDADAREIHPHYYDALVIPGGARSAKALSEDESIVELVRVMRLALRPLGAVGEGTVVLCAAGVLDGCHIAAPQSLNDAIRAAGGIAVGAQAVADRLIVTGQDAGAIDRFVELLAEEVAQARRDEVEELSLESFPASDAHGGGVAI